MCQNSLFLSLDHKGEGMRFIYLFIVLVVVGCENNRIGNLEVVRIDGLEGLTFDEAQERCERLGNEWRLPTIEELELIYENRFDIDGIKDKAMSWSLGRSWFGTFWSTTDCDGIWIRRTTIKLFDSGMTMCNPIIDNLYEAVDTLEYNALAVREIQ